MDVGEGGFGWLTGGDFYEGNKSKFLTQGALPLSLTIPVPCQKKTMNS